jgi:hypothetical protein
MNELHVGFTKKIKLPKPGFLLIDDAVPRFPQARIFDPSKHCFNPLKGIDYRKVLSFRCKPGLTAVLCPDASDCVADSGQRTNELGLARFPCTKHVAM